jgi:predicted DCC family thiol-disulfide oxidoreductase YuxK
MQRCWERLDQHDSRTRSAIAQQDGTTAQGFDALASLLERLEQTVATTTTG